MPGRILRLAHVIPSPSRSSRAQRGICSWLGAREPQFLLRASAVACASIFLAACEPPTDPIEKGSRQLLIQAVLDAGAQEQKVSVAWTEPSIVAQTTPVSGALVRIETPHGFSVTGTEDVADPDNPSRVEKGMYSVDLAGILLQAGATYTLRVTTPTGETVTGTTTIPRAAKADSVTSVPTFDRALDTLRLAWPRASGASAHQVAIRGEFVLRGHAFAYDSYLAFADTSITLAGTARTLDNNPVFRAGASAVVVVAAVDENYYAYYQPTIDPVAGAPQSRLNGALGVFGSIVPVLLRRYQEVR